MALPEGPMQTCQQLHEAASSTAAQRRELLSQLRHIPQDVDAVVSFCDAMDSLQCYKQQLEELMVTYGKLESRRDQLASRINILQARLRVEAADAPTSEGCTRSPESLQASLPEKLTCQQERTFLQHICKCPLSDIAFGRS
eukprot:TRINITY_DN7480_c0_g1_i1.p2 TRINITY_DN7480_c0_g1~~TRINITY_DN7480_c0_g1_i1.p2  ORF type:complete len:141 (-),score=15.99 TRINITY_DN7480_c0_g1_i1:504-926(-)